ncbi:MAG: PAS domain-containing sensor histidine kinase, partial [Deltaproteobacteria bacterium]|nr:PAS domain-containing sensor histidine kinase [Deltaproteobacteria bacterium]
EGGRIAVSVCGVRKLGERNLLEISVTDTGIGIEKKEAERIFERFVRVGKDSAADMGGTGLGLSIAASILELHKGYIHVGSEIGKGSVFTVGLPILEDVRCEM